MKKFFLTLLVAVMGLTASAQVYTGGEVGLWRNYDANKTNFTIAPEIGYNLSDKWAIGVGLDYTHLYNKGVKDNSIGINLYGRYNALSFGPVSFFVDGGAGFFTDNVKVGDGDSESYNAWEVGLKPGVKVSLTKKLDFVAHMGFLGYRDCDDELRDFVDNGLGFKFSSRDLSFGLLFNF